MMPMVRFIPAFPFVMTLCAFAFVLLIILMQKVPKVGTWLVAGLLVLVPLGVVSLGASRKFPHDIPAFPFVMVLCSFAFVLLIILLQKAPKVGAGVIVTIVVMVLVGLFLKSGASHRRMAYEQMIEGAAGNVRITQQTLPDQRRGELQAWEETYDHLLQSPQPSVLVAPPASPIWSEGIENEYEADVYPSKLAAVRALGTRMRRPIQEAAARIDEAAKIVIFQEENERSLVVEFKKAIEKALPEIPCSVAVGTRNIDSEEIAVTLRFVGVETRPAPWEMSRGRKVVTGDVLANARNRDWEANARQNFIEKPWVENYARFVSEEPSRHYITARSWEACTSGNEARQQAIQDACNQLTAIATQKLAAVPGRPRLTVNSQDVQEGGFILDQFIQSFDGTAGKIWRQAMLIDASAEKLTWLNGRKNAEVHVERITWARMILSAFGVVVVIVLAYLFLNMATKGYYEWSLRIAGMVLAIAGILSIFLVLR